MELQAVMEKRRSIRNYNPERKVTKEQLEELIKAASYAPSWKNLQTSRYYCVLSENAVKELREKCLPEFNQANSEGAGAYIVTTFVKGMVGFDKNTGSPVNEAGDGWGYYDLGLQNDNQAVMEKRRSIRNYNPERKVTKEQLEELIKAASYAPSWKNLQTSRYYCVLSENAVKELREKCLPEFNQANSEGAGAYIVTTFVKGMVGFDKNTGSPVNEAGDGWGYYDLGLQNDNLLLKAAELGLDTLVMGIRDGEALRELLNIPDSENVVSVIAVGYRGQEPPERPKRKELEVVAKFI